MDRIGFGEQDPSLDALGEIPWPSNTTKLVEFYPGVSVKVTVVDSQDEGLRQILEEFADKTTPMSIDLEWRPDKKHMSNPIAVFQFCSSKGVMIVLNSEEHGSPVLKEFLEMHQFIGKGMSVDRKKLRNMFSSAFQGQLEDIEQTLLNSYNLTKNFTDLVETVLGSPAAQFKDKWVSISNWAARPLSVKQILYAAFDAYAVFEIYKQIPRKFSIPADIPPQRKEKKESKKEKKLKKSMERVVKIPREIVRCSIDEILPFVRDPSEAVFKPRPLYSPKQSLFAHLCAYNELEKINEEMFMCHLCDMELRSCDAVDHAWNSHSDRITYVYFPDCSEAYRKKWFPAIHHAVSVCDCNPPNVECSLCKRRFPSFCHFFIHYRFWHWETCDEMIDCDAKTLVVEMWRKFFGARGLCCCDSEFESEDALRDHCWNQHGEFIANLVKHRPTLDESIFEESIENGIMCIDKLAYGEIRNGAITCAFCKTGFDNPGELFVHLLHRHSKIVCLSADEFPRWPLPVTCVHPRVITSIVSTCKQGAIDSHILESVPEGHVCTLCDEVLPTDSEIYQHLLQKHLALTFHTIATSE